MKKEKKPKEIKIVFEPVKEVSEEEIQQRWDAVFDILFNAAARIIKERKNKE